MEAPKQTIFATKWFIDYVDRTEDRGWGGGLEEQREMTEGDKQLLDTRRETSDAVAPLLSRPATPSDFIFSLLPYLPMHFLLFQSSIGKASQAFPRYLHPIRTDSSPDAASPASHSAPYLPKPINVSHTRSPSRRLPCPRAKMEDSPHLGPPSARFPWPMTKAITSLSAGGRELVLLVTSFISTHARCSAHPVQHYSAPIPVLSFPGRS